MILGQDNWMSILKIYVKSWLSFFSLRYWALKITFSLTQKIKNYQIGENETDRTKKDGDYLDLTFWRY